MLPTTTKQLYPTSSIPEFWTLLLSVSTGDRNEHGNFILRRNLTPGEMHTLRERASALAPWLTPGKQSQIAEAVTQMIIGFATGTVSKSEAAAIATQYVKTLQDMPIWCIIRACNRFALGEVTKEELGGDTWDRAFRPSTAQLRRIAHAIVKPFAEESTRIFMTSRGTTGRPADPAERLRVGEKMTEFAEELLAAQREAEAIETVADQARRYESAQRTYSMILREYHSRRIDPVYQDAGRTIPISLSMLISMGWEIQDHPEGGGKILVAPPPQPAPRGREFYDAGS